MHAMRALIGDANDVRRARLASTLADVGCRVHETAVLATVPELARRIGPDLVLLAASAHDEPDALRAAERVHQAKAQIPVLFIAERGSEASAVGALRAGARDYFREPLDGAAIAASARRWLLASADQAGRFERPDGDRGPAAAVPFVAASSVMRGLREYVRKVAANDATVLITGETGTGKELIAALIHAQSRRHRARFVSINCPAIPEGLLESELFGHESGAFTGAAGPRQGLLQAADRGTVFFDEIGDMAPLAQVKILRAIETREVYHLGGKRAIPIDVRVIAATNQDLERAVDEGRFRKDLYYRLNVARVHLPALRERRSDIPALLEYYLRESNRRCTDQVEGFTDEALERLTAYDWPGNVREVKNLVEALFISPPAGRVSVADLPAAFRRRLAAVRSIGGDERRRLMDALLEADWNKSRAAEKLHWSRMTVYRKMSKYAIARSR